MSKKLSCKIFICWIIILALFFQPVIAHAIGASDIKDAQDIADTAVDTGKSVVGTAEWAKKHGGKTAAKYADKLLNGKGVKFVKKADKINGVVGKFTGFFLKYKRAYDKLKSLSFGKLEEGLSKKEKIIKATANLAAPNTVKALAKFKEARKKLNANKQKFEKAKKDVQQKDKKLKTSSKQLKKAPKATSAMSMDRISAVLSDRRALIELISAGSKDLGDIASILGVAGDICSALGFASSLSPAGPAFASAGKLLHAAAASLNGICTGLDNVVSASWAEDKVYTKKAIAQRYESGVSKVAESGKLVINQVNKAKKFGRQIGEMLSSKDKSIVSGIETQEPNTLPQSSSRKNSTPQNLNTPAGSVVRSPLKPPTAL